MNVSCGESEQTKVTAEKEKVANTRVESRKLAKTRRTLINEAQHVHIPIGCSTVFANFLHIEITK